ncbi:MAG: hypothetical protein AAF399_13810 [Bacteroidota bacterium]
MVPDSQQGASHNWGIAKINGRYWLMNPQGERMYVLGLNHIYSVDEADQRTAIHHLESWGFNSAGYGAPPTVMAAYPGFISLRLHDAPHWLPANRFRYEDVFSVSFEAKVKEIIRQKCEQGKGNDQVMGYSLTDTPRYDLDLSRKRRGMDWVSFIRSQGADAAGKQRYVDFLRTTYQDQFEEFQQAYRLERLTSFEELLDYDFQYLELTRPAVRRDDEAFLAIIAEKLYQLTRTYFEEFHPGALLLSEKFKMHDHPEAILRLAGKYFDIISIQPGPTIGPDAGQGPDESEFDPAYWQQLHALTQKPILITDHGFSFFSQEYPRTLWHQFASEAEAAAFYETYLTEVIQQPFIIGYLKCQYQSQYDPLRSLLKQGLLDPEGMPYSLLVQEVSRINRLVLNRVYQK